MRVPFDVVDGRIYVQAKVNDHGPYRFAVDTGASGFGRADSRLVAALDLRIEEPTQHSDGVNTAAVDTTMFEKLEVGGLVRSKLQVITRDYSSRMTPEAAIDGIVAREFFADGVLIIDYPAKTLTFSRDLKLSPQHDDVLTYQKPFRVPIQIGELRTEGNLDTGANIAFVLPQTVFDQVDGTAPHAAKDGQLANTRVETQRSTVHGPFRIGALHLHDVEVRVSSRYPEVLVGAHALQNHIVVIDQRSNSVALCEPLSS